jgi:hypothetical protein
MKGRCGGCKDHKTQLFRVRILTVLYIQFQIRIICSLGQEPKPDLDLDPIYVYFPFQLKIRKHVMI